jgi:hypothetical protein
MAGDHAGVEQLDDVRGGQHRGALYWLMDEPRATACSIFMGRTDHRSKIVLAVIYSVCFK